MIICDLSHWAEHTDFDAPVDIFHYLPMPWYPLIDNQDTREAIGEATPHMPWSNDDFFKNTGTA
ncbi:MAG: hypothetical protein CBB68_07230 [Rhodospirillaceae bacterium TMED8]|nr:hypothetical protein [Magnetovibrio sp.]OUT50783.1 MAG: hypothetical protein CBB68_07230 [Rhodospirillaceae bacterium TMED8]